jgi:integrase
MQVIRKFARGQWYECRPAENGIWHIHWTDGRRSKRHSTRQKTLAGAQAYLDEWTALEAEAVSAVPTCATLWAERYDDDRTRAAWKHLGPHFGRLTPPEVTQAVENAYRASRDCAASTLRFELACLRASWAYAVKHRRLPADAVPHLDALPPPSPPRERWLTDEEIAAVFAAAEENRRVRLFLWLALHTGARRTAIQELKWSQVDWAIRVIHFNPPGRAQTKKRRASVPMSDDLYAVLRAAYDDRPDKFDQHVIGRGPKINHALEHVVARSGVEGVTPHVMRHTAGTIMARSGVPLWTIAKILGNTVEMVERVYAKSVPEMHRAAVNVIGRRA